MICFNFSSCFSLFRASSHHGIHTLLSIDGPNFQWPNRARAPKGAAKAAAAINGGEVEMGALCVVCGRRFGLAGYDIVPRAGLVLSWIRAEVGLKY
jgi:hypothetical protein